MVSYLNDLAVIFLEFAEIFVSLDQMSGHRCEVALNQCPASFLSLLFEQVTPWNGERVLLCQQPTVITANALSTIQCMTVNQTRHSNCSTIGIRLAN